MDQDRIEHDILIYEEELKNRYAEEGRKNARIMSAIKSQLGEKYFRAVLDCIMECEGYGLYELEREPGGHKQMEEWFEFDHIYVDQWRNGGYSGDEFAGNIWIPLKENLYLKVRYEM